MSRTFKFCIRQYGRPMVAAAVLASGGSLASLALPALAQEPPPQMRSLTDVRPRIPDEHDRPYFRETQTHRGWEIREPQFTVFASTSAADAQLAAGHVSQAWNQAAALASRWTSVPGNPDFGLSALQVVIDSEPVRDRDAPLTTVNVTGIQTQVQINVGPGQPGLQQQLVRLREGAAFAMLHAAGLDSAAPPWVVAGVAAQAGRSGLTPEELKRYSDPSEAAQFGGQQWRFERSADDTLDYRRIDHEQAAGQVAFLLNGDDAMHAPAFLAALRAGTSGAATAAAEGAAFQNFPGDTRPATANSSFDQLLHGLAGQYATWKEQPLTGQPVFEPAKDVPADLLTAEREMLVILKLQQRSTVTDGNSVATIQRGGTRMKIVTFDRTKGPTAGPAKQESPAASYSALAARLTDPARPDWGTIDADGSLLLSTDTQRVNELLGAFNQRYTLERQNERTILVRRLEGQRTLRGWLEDNPKDKARPLAKFEMVDLRTKTKPAQPTKQERQVRLLP